MKHDTNIYIVPSIAFDNMIDLVVSRGDKRIKILCDTKEEAFTTIEKRANEIETLLGPDTDKEQEIKPIDFIWY